MNEWRPIETAPRDGTEVLLYDGRIRQIGSWCGCYVGDGEWLMIHEQDGGFREARPTHWMPLPEAPK